MRCQLLHLVEHFFEQIFRRLAAILHADGHVGAYLVKGLGNRMQTRNPVVVILHGREAELGHQLWKVVVDAVHLVHRHLPLLELSPFLLVGQLTQEKVAAGLFLVAQSRGINLRQAQQKVLSAAQLVVHSPHRIV